MSIPWKISNKNLIIFIISLDSIFFLVVIYKNFFINSLIDHQYKSALISSFSGSLFESIYGPPGITSKSLIFKFSSGYFSFTFLKILSFSVFLLSKYFVFIISISSLSSSSSSLLYLFLSFEPVSIFDIYTVIKGVGNSSFSPFLLFSSCICFKHLESCI